MNLRATFVCSGFTRLEYLCASKQPFPFSLSRSKPEEEEDDGAAQNIPIVTQYSRDSLAFFLDSATTTAGADSSPLQNKEEQSLWKVSRAALK